VAFTEDIDTFIVMIFMQIMAMDILLTIPMAMDTENVIIELLTK
jgi:hypothetical protein